MPLDGRPQEGYDRTTPVLILKMGSQPLHHGTLAVVRSLGRVGVPVYSSREETAAPPGKSRYLTSDVIGVLPPSDPEFSIAQLKAFRRRVGRPAMLLPVDDNGAIFVAENAEILRPHFILPRQRPELPRTVASKANNKDLCAIAGVATPETLVVRADDDVAKASAATSYPAVVKIAQPWLLPPGLRPTILALCAEDVVDYRARLEAWRRADLVIQEYIPQEQAEDWFYHGYHDGDGEPLVGFTGRKLRSYPPFLGASSYAVSIVNPNVLGISQELLRRLKYAGIVELEFRFDRRDGRYKIIDVNPRLGAQFQLLRNEAGIDVVRAQHLHQTGRSVPSSRQVEGVRFTSDFTDIAAFPTYWRQGMTTPAAWLSEQFRAHEHAWFSFDDIRPFSAAGSLWARRVPTHLMRAITRYLRIDRRRRTAPDSMKLQG